MFRHQQKRFYLSAKSSSVGTQGFQNKISSVLAQQYVVAQILEARILEDINKSNHIEVDNVNNLDLSPN